jgi:cell division protein FtsB
MDIRVAVEKIEDVRERAHRRKKTLASAAMILIAVLLAYHVFAGTNGISVYFKKKAENRALQQELDQLRKENEDLNHRVKALKSDPQTIEKEAREQLKYAKPGEVIYVMPEQKPATPPANATAQKDAAPKKP